MKTKFKRDIDDKFQRFGAYFISENDITTQYLIELHEGSFVDNALVKIYKTDILSNHFNIDGLKVGDIIGVLETKTDWMAEVNLCGKYFFPKFNNKGKCKNNSITSLMEAINFAIDYGLDKGGIKPY